MTDQPSQLWDLLLPKELLKPFQDIEEEYIGPFIFEQMHEHTTDRQEKEFVKEELSEKDNQSFE